MKVSRRTFLTSAAAATLGSTLFLGLSWRAKKSWIQGAQASVHGPEGVSGTLVAVSSGELHLIDLASGNVASCNIPCKRPHSVVLAPHTLDMALTIDQDAPSASVVNLRTLTLTKEIRASEGNSFSGHGCFSPEGSLFYITQYPRNKKELGELVVYETKGWKRVAAYSSGGAQSHYVQPLKAGTIIAVGHYGKIGEGTPMTDGILSLMNAETGKIEEVVRAKNPYHSLCHMEKTADDTLLITTRAWVSNKEGSGFRNERHDITPVIIGSPWKKNWKELQPPTFAEKMRLNFTVAVDSEKRVGLATHLFSNSISKWSLDGEENFLNSRTFPGEGPLGLGMGVGRGLYLVHTDIGRLYFLNPQDLSTAWIMDLNSKIPAAGPHFALSGERYLASKLKA